MVKAPPRDFVRFSPLGFSMAVAVVILLATGGFAAGYLWGIRSERVRASSAAPATVILPSLGLSAQTAVGTPSEAGSGPTVTFYSELAGTVDKTPSENPRSPESGARPVRQERPKDEAPSAPTAKTTPPTGPPPSARSHAVIVQVASYPAPAQAHELKGALEREGYRCEIQEADLGPRGRWYRVRIGPFPDEAQARKAMARIERERSFKGYIVP